MIAMTNARMATLMKEKGAPSCKNPQIFSMESRLLSFARKPRKMLQCRPSETRLRMARPRSSASVLVQNRLDGVRWVCPSNDGGRMSSLDANARDRGMSTKTQTWQRFGGVRVRERAG